MDERVQFQEAAQKLINYDKRHREEYQKNCYYIDCRKEKWSAHRIIFVIVFVSDICLFL